MKKIILISIGLSMILVINALSQTAGSLDNSFNGTGVVTYDFGHNDNITDIKIQPDQKIVAVGVALNASFAGSVMATRLMPDGSFDDSFGTNGKVVFDVNTESYAYECLILNSGKIILTGISYNPSYNASVLLMRLNEDGTLETSFDNDGIVEANFSSGDDFGYGLIELPDHKIIIAGSVMNNLFQNIPTLIRFNENGSVDGTFGTNGLAQIPVTDPDNVFRNIAISDGGKIVASGHFDNGVSFEGSADTDVLVARFNSDGSLDTDFGTAGVSTTSISTDNYDAGFGMKVTSDESVIVTGFTIVENSTYDMVLLKYLSTGELDEDFGVAGIVQFDNSYLDTGYDLEIQGDNKILIAGTTGNADFTNNEFFIARYNADGTADLTFGGVGFVATQIASGLDDANGMAIQMDGRIVLGGKAQMENNNDIALVRYIAEDIISVEEQTTSRPFSIFPNPVLVGGSIQIRNKSGTSTNSPIEICDLTGKKITSFNSFLAAGATQNFSIQIPSLLSAGFYVLKIINHDGTSTSLKFEVAE